MSRYAFGPVPSRRLGRSLGVNNVPYKYCTYTCVYCQAGRTTRLVAERHPFYPPKELARDVARAASMAGRVDYVTFVPNGEPTLDARLGEEAALLKELVDAPLALITNGSLLYREDVRQDASIFDLVSVKVDAALEASWRRVNRPHPSLDFGEVVEGLRAFAREYRGKLLTETMLVDGINTEELEALASLVSQLRPDKAYISVPIRPPAEPWVKPPDEGVVLAAYEAFAERLGRDRVELLTGYEGAGFRPAGNPLEQLLAITSVHPVRLDYAYEFLEARGLDPDRAVEELVSRGDLAKREYRGYVFLVRRIRPART